MSASGTVADLPPETVSSHEFYTVDEMAAVLRVHAQTVRRWIALGQVASTKAGRCHRIARSEFERVRDEGVDATGARGVFNP